MPRGRPRKWLTWKEILNIRRIYQVIRDNAPVCQCGNDELKNFLFFPDPLQARIRIRCLICNRQKTLNEKHEWYAKWIETNQKYMENP